MFAEGHWNRLPTKVKPDLKDVFLTSLKSRADSTEKKYKKEILTFIGRACVSANGSDVYFKAERSLHKCACNCEK